MVDTKMLKEISEKVKVGQTLGYVERNNWKDTKTLTDSYNKFEKAINGNKDDLLAILNAIFDVSDDNTINKSLVVSMMGSKYMITNTKDGKTGEMKITKNASIFKVTEKISGKNKPTIVELTGVIEKKKTIEESLHDQ